MIARDLLFDRAHAPLQRAQRLERGLRLREHGALRDRAHLLAQVADARAAAQHDRAGVGRVHAREHAQQRGLAGPVAADQPDPVVGAHVQRRALEQRAPTERLRGVFQTGAQRAGG